MSGLKKGEIMTKSVINKVQDFLTVINEDGNRVYQIVNVEYLLRKHPTEAVISFLTELRNDYSKQLKQLLKENVSNERINNIVSNKFRIKMAISIIKNHEKKEVKAA